MRIPGTENQMLCTVEICRDAVIGPINFPAYPQNKNSSAHGVRNQPVAAPLSHRRKIQKFQDIKSLLGRGATTGLFLTAWAHAFLFCGYAGKLLVPITASLLLPPRNLNVDDFYGTKHLIFCSGDTHLSFLLMYNRLPLGRLKTLLLDTVVTNL